MTAAQNSNADPAATPAVVIMGGGPAGLTAGLETVRRGGRCTVLEKDDIVGGLSRTARHGGYRFDIGGHRFFTKSDRVQKFWESVLADQFLQVPRLSRIYYNNTFFHYPLRPWNALFGLGIFRSIGIILSYLWIRVRPLPEEKNFEQWVTNRFGRQLFRIFFKTYTEKVWGVPCTEIQAEWAAQRIKGLSLWKAAMSALMPWKAKGVKTLIDKFNYPKFGPGQMWEAVTDLICGAGSAVELRQGVTRIRRTDTAVTAVVTAGPDGAERVHEGTHFLSSLPMRELVAIMDPPAPEKVRAAAERLRYRDFITVALVIRRKEMFPDNWIYIHSPEVNVGRIQNFKNWSPFMLADTDKTCLGLEYFAFEGREGLWGMSDEELKKLAAKEVEQLGFCRADEIDDAAVVRAPKAYPMYDPGYQDAVNVLRDWLKSLGNLQLIGRNGMHRYNNQDHSMMTAMLAVENIYGGSYDLWKVNIDAEYHEEQTEGEVAEADKAKPYAPPPAVSGSPAPAAPPGRG